MKAPNWKPPPIPFAKHKISGTISNCSKANKVLNWREVWDRHSTFEKTVNWYRSFYEEQKVLTESDLKHYVESATSKGLSWTIN